MYYVIDWSLQILLLNLFSSAGLNLFSSVGLLAWGDSLSISIKQNMENILKC